MFKEIKNELRKIGIMKTLDTLFISIFVMTCLLGGCHLANRAFSLKDDNIIEELIEDVIESQSGIKIDLTPN